MFEHFKEPKAPRYIYVNPVNNKVHLLVPIVGGQEIATDNTCRSRDAAINFFGNGASEELSRYRDALNQDILMIQGELERRLLDNTDVEALWPEELARKQSKLEQINYYIDSLSCFPAPEGTFSNLRGPVEDSIRQVLRAQSNAFSMHLRPDAPDTYGHVESPVFSLHRGHHSGFSRLYSALRQLNSLSINNPSSRDRLIQAVTGALANRQNVNLSVIQATLRTETQRLFGVDVSFTHRALGQPPVTEAEIRATLMLPPEEALETADAIETLLGLTAGSLFEQVSPQSSFHNVSSASARTDRLSLMTQFFLAHVNMYCFSKGISRENFGAKLDASQALSAGVAQCVRDELGTDAESVRNRRTNGDVGQSLCAFINANHRYFRLTRQLNAEDIALIQAKFERTYRTVTGTNENRHMDEFLFLDRNVENGQFFTHQGSICTDFSTLVATGCFSRHFRHLSQDHKDYFRQLHRTGLCLDADSLCEVPHKNEHVALPVGETSFDPDAEAQFWLEDDIFSTEMKSMFLGALVTTVVTAALSTALMLAAEMTWLLALACSFPVAAGIGIFAGLSFFNASDDKSAASGSTPAFAV
jgi:hypothetical protein